jgi:positive regulator of sigma E activity
MLRAVLVLIGAIAIVFVAATVVRTLFWLALIAVIIAFISTSLGFVRFGRRPGSRSRNRRYLAGSRY